MEAIPDRPSLEELDAPACVELLRWCTVGRVAVNDADGPLVVPVNFVLDDEHIVFRTGEGTKLERIVTGDAISFQVDGFDHLHESGWSVLVRGLASELDVVDHLHLQPWSGGARGHWIRIVPVAVTGRRILIEELPFDDRGYR